MALFLRIIACAAALSAALGLFEIAATWARDATVFQQISARVSVGLSLLVMVCSFGFAALIDGAQPQPQPQRRPDAAAGPALQRTETFDVAAAPGATPRGTPIAKVDGINIYRDGDRVLAIVGGESLHAPTVGELRRYLTARKNSA